MNRPCTSTATKRSQTHAFSLMEVVLSMLVVSVMLVAALSTVGASQMGKHKMTTRARGLLLARSLMSEILQCAYEDPEDPSTSLGCEATESDVDRTDYDDVDDYDGWESSPPVEKPGSGIPWADGYRRIVTVQWVDPLDLDQASGTSTGVKRIRVIVEYQDRQVARLWAFRTEAWAGP